ncbi:hypothetical protein [Asticcacaulis solisilvae]|uniref:hypothetical protein n=1 Tax=Asticcacaulis solisilvae TaxID=1217274 RepID=UPI003FD78DBA
MSFRLYESAWVRIEGTEQPLQVHRDGASAGVFIVGDHWYDIDARALPSQIHVPPIVSILSLEAVREAGLRSGYDRDLDAMPQHTTRWFGRPKSIM